jgi:uncharacterized protein (TIGR03437 family)
MSSFGAWIAGLRAVVKMLRHLWVGVAVVAALPGQTLTTIANFSGAFRSPTDLILGPDGKFYGVAQELSAPQPGGVIFRMTPAGTVASLETATPVGNGSALVSGQDGNIYGVSFYGGNANQGTFFQFTTSGAFAILYNFGGASPIQSPSVLLQAPDGTFYGTATSVSNTGPGGAIFSARIANGNLTLSTIYNFTNGSSAVNLAMGSDGILYGLGATNNGGTFFFGLTPSGEYTLLYTLSPANEGSIPTSLIAGSDGNFYGLTQAGGAHGAGTLFKGTPAGEVTVLYAFPPGGSGLGFDRADPLSLVQGSDGNLYGATVYGGANNSGSIFRATTSGSFTTLYSFSSTPGNTWLMQAANETLYGIAGDMAFTLTLPLSAGGAYTCSNATPPVITTVESASAYGNYSYFGSGSWIEIKGTNLADPNDPRLSAATNSGQWTTADFFGPNAPMSLDGISATINGKSAYVWYLSPTQINVQAPEDTFTGNVTVSVTNCGATSPAFGLTKRSLAPGLLAPSNYAANGTQYLVATFASDGAYVLNTSLGATYGLNSRPAKPGDEIIAYGIGFGDVTPSILPGTIAGVSNTLVNPVTISFGSAPATILYQGMAGGFVGLYEFYFTVPAGLANRDYQINVAQNGTAVPQTLYLTVQN